MKQVISKKQSVPRDDRSETMKSSSRKKFVASRSSHEEGGSIRPGREKRPTINRDRSNGAREIASSTPTAGRQIATTALNAYEAYGAATAARAFIGDLLKFSKGEYLAGVDQYEVPIGTELAVAMSELVVGWVKWVDGARVDQRCGPIQSFQPPQRHELGDDDQDAWDSDDEGRPRDPWQFENRVPMIGTDDEQSVFTFTTSSRGGLSAIGELAKTYGHRLHTHPNEFPIVKLGVGSYAHRNRSFGRIKYPIFEVIGWTDSRPLQALLTDSPNDPDDRAYADDR
jgi:hypothetical protein